MLVSMCVREREREREARNRLVCELCFKIGTRLKSSGLHVEYFIDLNPETTEYGLTNSELGLSEEGKCCVSKRHVRLEACTFVCVCIAGVLGRAREGCEWNLGVGLTGSLHLGEGFCLGGGWVLGLMLYVHVSARPRLVRLQVQHDHLRRNTLL